MSLGVRSSPDPMQRVRHILSAALLCLLLAAAAARAAEDAAERFEVLHAGSPATRRAHHEQDAHGRVPAPCRRPDHREGQGPRQDHPAATGLPCRRGCSAGGGAAKADPGPAFSDLELDPRYEEIAEQIIWETQSSWPGWIARHPWRHRGRGAALPVFLLLLPSPLPQDRPAGQRLVWLPWLKLLPLLRAAGMRPWWLVTTLVPGINVITYVVWSFKIARARGKGRRGECAAAPARLQCAGLPSTWPSLTAWAVRNPLPVPQGHHALPTPAPQRSLTILRAVLRAAPASRPAR